MWLTFQGSFPGARCGVGQTGAGIQACRLRTSASALWSLNFKIARPVLQASVVKYLYLTLLSSVSSCPHP